VSTGRRAARLAIRAYQLSLSGIAGRQCRHWPTCSAYADQAIARYGVWPGVWMGVARLCRCGPFGTHGIDLVPVALPMGAAWYRPWSYGRWRGVEAPPLPPGSLLVCEEVSEPPPAPPGSLRALLAGDSPVGSTPRQET
jgi:hypothetical protein